MKYELPLSAAFPKKYTHLIDNIHAKAPVSSPSAHGYFSSIIDGEKLYIPCRIYIDSTSIVNKYINAIEEQIILCYLTRHHNGYVREESLRKLFCIKSLEYFVIPYVFKLAEEYVIELLYIIRESFLNIPQELISLFIKENPQWTNLMHSRCASYWDCYYRLKHRSLKDYPGIEILRMMKAIGVAL